MEVYGKDAQSVSDTGRNVRESFACYNHERMHHACDSQTPAQVSLKRESREFFDCCVLSSCYLKMILTFGTAKSMIMYERSGKRERF